MMSDIPKAERRAKIDDSPQFGGRSLQEFIKGPSELLSGGEAQTEPITIPSIVSLCAHCCLLILSC